MVKRHVGMHGTTVFAGRETHPADLRDAMIEGLPAAYCRSEWLSVRCCCINFNSCRCVLGVDAGSEVHARDMTWFVLPEPPSTIRLDNARAQRHQRLDRHGGRMSGGRPQAACK